MLSGDVVKSAVARRLAALFEGVTVYKEKVNQHLKYPHFFILQLNLSREKDLAPFNWLNYQLNIRYRPNKNFDSQYSELDQIGLDMLDGLESVEVEGVTLRPTDMNYQIVDGVLQFFINFRMRVNKEQKDGAVMEELFNSANVKEEE